MTGERFVYKGKLYKYTGEEVWPSVYEDEFPCEFIKLLDDRAESIRNLNAISVDFKDENADTTSNYGKLAEGRLDNIYMIEKNIEEYMSEHNINCSWYSPTKPQEIPEDYEEQRRKICFDCGEIFSYDTVLEYKEYKQICPKCNGQNIHVVNIHQYNAERLEELAEELIDREDFKGSIIKREEAIEEYKKIDPFYNEIYAEAVANIAIAYQNNAKINLIIGEDRTMKVLPFLEKSVVYWDKLIEMDCLQTVANFGDMSVCHMLILQTKNEISETRFDEMEQELKAVHDYIEKAKDVVVSWYDANLMGITKEMVDEASADEENMKLKSYNVILRFCYAKNLSEKIEQIGKQASDYLASCKYLAAEELDIHRNDFEILLGGENYSYNNTTQKTAKEGCYIATAVYGDYNAPEVLVLREYRDNILKRSWLGRTFIKIYYTLSPSIAKRLKYATSLNRWVRQILDKFVEYLSTNY